MLETIPQDWIDDRNKSITHGKAAAIGKIFGLFNGLIYGGGLQPETRKELQIEKLSGHDYYAVRDGLEKFLVGMGEEDTGFVGQILAAQDTEEFRAVVNSYGSSAPAVQEMKPNAENVLRRAKAWLATSAWMDLQFDLKPLRSPMSGTTPGPHPAPTGP